MVWFNSSTLNIQQTSLNDSLICRRIYIKTFFYGDFNKQGLIRDIEFIIDRFTSFVKDF
jgi:hypothetical protein